MTGADEPAPADAEARVAEAEARAEAARARAADLRRRLEVLKAPPAAAAAPIAPRALITPLIAALATLALLSATGYMLWQHRVDGQHRRLTAEYAAAARQGVVNLMSVDYATAQDTVQRVLDGSTGRFRSNFEESADEFVKALQEEKIITRAIVNDAAVDSISGDTAVVLVSASSQREGPQAPKEQQQPRVWRVVVTVQREGDQMKMSAVEFV